MHRVIKEKQMELQESKLKFDNLLKSKEEEILELKNIIKKKDASSPKINKQRIIMQNSYTEKDMSYLVEYLNMPVPEDWDQYSLAIRRNYYYNKEKWRGTPRDYFCTQEVACEFFGYKRSQLCAKVGRFVASCIRGTKLFSQPGYKKRFGEYGSALAWIRCESKNRNVVIPICQSEK